MRGVAEPRRENCPLDNFLFLLFDSLVLYIIHLSNI